VLRATLHNGLRVVIVRNPLAPVVTTEINYLVGSNEAPDGFPGTAHALEHMMFRGSPGLSANQLAATSAAMGGMFDADTQQTVTQYVFTVPTQDLDVALRIEAMRMDGLQGGEKLWQQERGAIEQEVAQDLSNPEYIFYTRLLETLFKGTPYAVDALGTRPSFDKTTGAMLRAFHRTWYAPNNAVLVIVGDVDPDSTLSLVKQHFGHLAARPLPPRPAVRLEPVQPETIQLPTDRAYGLVALAFRLPGFNSPDHAAAQVLGDVLTSQRCKLYGLVPEGKALFTDFSLEALPEASLGYAVAGFPKGGDSSALLESVRSVVAGMVRDGFPAELVEAAKQHEIADAETEKNSISGLASVWSQAVAVEGRQSPDDNVEAIRKVTVEDVNRVAHQFLDQAHAVAVVMTPQSSGKPVPSTGFARKESLAAGQVHDVKLPGWAQKVQKGLTVPPSHVHPTVTVLPNGLTLIVQPESISHSIGVYGHIRNRPELEAPSGRDGVDEVLDRLFSFGTTSLDRLAFQKALDDISANETAGTDFFLEVPPQHFDRGVALLADNQLHPALPREAFEIVKQQVAAAVAGRLKSPGYLARHSLAAALFPEHDPTLRQATPKTVSGLSLEDVKDYYRKVVRPDLAVIVVIGDVDPETAKSVIGKYFGAWQASGPKPDVLLPAVPPNPPAAVVVPNASRVQDEVTLAQTLGITRTDPDYYPLELGNHVLGGAFYATRLYRELRENSGLVYYVGSSLEAGDTRAIYSVAYACDPPNVSKVRALIVRQLRDMQAKPVTPAELRQAKSLLLTEIPLGESSVERIAHGLVYRASHRLPLDEPTRAAERYVKLDAPQVQAAFAKWLRPDQLVEVVQGPNPR
jgi:zinc protease